MESFEQLLHVGFILKLTEATDLYLEGKSFEFLQGYQLY
jgi:hypothetical protein